MTIARELADIIQSNGDVVISGGLEVNGTTTTINTTTFVVEDKNIELGGNATSNSQNDGAGISILLPDASPDEFATLTYVNSSDAWSFNRDLEISGQVRLSSGGPVLVLNDFDAATPTEQVGYISFQRQGSEKAWIGHGGTSNDDFTIRNNEGVVTLSGGADVTAGDLQVGGTTVIDSSRNLTNIGLISATGNGTSTSPVISITSSNSQSFIHASNAFASNMTAGNFHGHFFGKAGSTKNSGAIGYYWAADGSDSNFVSIGHWGADHLLRIYGDGTLNINSGGLQMGGATVLDSSRNLTNIGNISSAGESHFYKTGTVGTQTIVAIIGSNSNRPTLQFSESTSTAINAGMSLEYNGTGNVDANFMSINDINGASKFQFTSGGDFKIGSTTVIDSSRAISSGPVTVTQNSGQFIAQTSSDPTNYYAKFEANYDYGQAFRLAAKGAGSEYYIMTWGDAEGLEFNGGANSIIKFSGDNLSNIGTISSGAITSSADLALTGNGTEIGFTGGNNRILFSGYRALEGATDGGLLQVGEGYTTVQSHGDLNLTSGHAYQVNGTTVIDSSRNLTNIGTISSGGITTLGSSVFNSYSTSDPSSTSRTNYPAGNMFTHYSQANGVSIIGGQGSYTGSSLTIGEETARSANFKLIRGISDTNGTPAEEFSINGVGDAVFAGTISSGAITSSGPIKLSGSGNGQEVQVVKGQSGSFTTVTIELQFPGPGSYSYEVGVSGTTGCGIQFGGGYTNGVGNFTHTGNQQLGSAWTVTSPSNDLVRLVSPSSVVGTHPTAYVKARFGLTDGFDEADISITFS